MVKTGDLSGLGQSLPYDADQKYRARSNNWHYHSRKGNPVAMGHVGYGNAAL